ncbi:MAG: LacI family DNA-binding transcriptional regulator [Niabella sp.]
MAKRVSLKDIAEKVGVSVALVSYVLNDRFKNRISKTVADKIRKAAEELDYRPNQIARSLKTSKTFTIGLIVADIANPFSSMLARIIEDEAAVYGYTVISGSSDEDLGKFKKLIDAFMKRQVDGLIILPPEGAEPQLLDLIRTKKPFVIADRYFREIEANCVNVDNIKAAYDAVTQFVNNGKRRIAMMGYETRLQHLNDRIEGYRNALNTAGILFDEQLLKKVHIKNDPEEITAAAAALLSSEMGIDALLFGSNRIAVHALKYIRDNNIHVPEDIQLIGFDETEVFDFFLPQISFVKQPMQQLGQKATALLMQSMAGNETREKIFIPAELIIRASAMNKQ